MNSTGLKVNPSDIDLKRLATLLISKKIIFPKNRYVLGLSGGPDSVFLFHLFLEFSNSYDIVFYAAHFNHSLRDEADLDELFCKQLADRYHVQFISKKEKIQEDYQKSKLSLEEYARVRRHLFFQEILKESDSDWIVLGHHQDDLIETFFMRICVGTGLEGLSSIRPISKKIVHPLLWTSKDEIISYLVKKNIPYRDDSSNFDMGIIRNFFRHSIIPQIEQSYKNCRQNVANLVEIIRDENEYIKKNTEKFVKKNIENTGLTVKISQKPFMNLPIAIQRRVFFKYLPVPQFRLIDEIIRKIKTGLCDGKHIVSQNRLSVYLDDGNIIVSSMSQSLPMEFSEKINFSKHGQILLKQIQCRLVWEILPKVKKNILIKKNEVCLDASKVTGFGIIRNRKSGDSIKMIGMNGRQSLKKMFINRKISVHKRGLIPVLEHKNRVCAVFLNFADSKKNNYISSDVVLDENSQFMLRIWTEKVR